MNSTEGSKEFLQDKCHVMTGHLEADSETDEVEKIKDLVTEHGASLSPSREDDVVG